MSVQSVIDATKSGGDKDALAAAIYAQRRWDADDVAAMLGIAPEMTEEQKAALAPNMPAPHEPAKAEGAQHQSQAQHAQTGQHVGTHVPPRREA